MLMTEEQRRRIVKKFKDTRQSQKEWVIELSKQKEDSIQQKQEWMSKRNLTDFESITKKVYNYVDNYKEFSDFIDNADFYNIDNAARGLTWPLITTMLANFNPKKYSIYRGPIGASLRFLFNEASKDLPTKDNSTDAPQRHRKALPYLEKVKNLLVAEGILDADYLLVDIFLIWVKTNKKKLENI